MKKHLFFLVILLFCFSSYAQLFEKGYIIDSNDKKIECFIKNENWNYNPKKIEYKITEDSELKIATVENIKEFRVANATYKRFIVSTTEILFLRYLIEGTASLYTYVDSNSKRYFYTIDNYEITPLINKKKRTTNNGISAIRNEYKLHISDYLKCNAIPSKEVETIKYSSKSLTDYFIKYNDCIGSKYVIYDKPNAKGAFNFKIKAGINTASLSIPSLDLATSSENFVDFGTSIGYRAGFEAEFILPINKKKWSIIIEPSYSSFKSESTTLNSSPEMVNVTYSVLELPIGIRHNFILNESSKIYLDGAYALSFNLDSSIDFENTTDIEFSKGTHWAFGIGYEFKNKYSVELKYYTSNNNLFKESFYHSDYNNIAITLAYTIFQRK